MFPMFNLSDAATQDSFRNVVHEQGKRALEMNKRLHAQQMDAWKHGEKAMLQGVEQGRHLLELSFDLQKAAWQSWMDIVTPKASAEKAA